jgi:hypothetical protein
VIGVELLTRAGNGGAVRRDREVQDARGVSGELGDLGHGGVLPEAELVLAKAVGGQQLALVGRPLQGAHLEGRKSTPNSSFSF